MPISVNDAYQQIAGFAPNPMQEAMFAQIASGDCAALLKAPTGSGKTEAVLVPALTGLLNSEPRRLFLILPTRSLVDDQVGRIEKTFEQLSKSLQKRLALVVDTGGQSWRKVWQNGRAEKQRRHLYDGDVIVTTLDKFLYRFFSFGEPFKNYIFPLRILYGAKKPLFCFDEAHTYEDVAFTNFVNLVRTLAIDKGQDVVVMTATMPSAFVAQLKFLSVLDFVDDSANNKVLEDFYSRPHKDRMLEYVSASSDELVSRLIEQAKQRYQPGQRVIVTAEQVKDAIAIFEALRNQFGDDVLLYHGRIPDQVEEHPDRGRTAIYQELKRRDDDKDKKNQGYLLVTTSAIEVGCDLNAHTLITELCNPDQLIQRAGRCNRKGEMPDAKVIVVGDEIKAWLSDLDEEEQEAYRNTLRRMNGQPLDRNAILSHLRVRPQMDYRVQEMFSMLYEYVYEANQVYKGVHEKGMVITRSWEPSLTVCTGFDSGGHPLNPVSVSLPSLVARKDEQVDMQCRLYRRYYEGDESHQYKLEEVNGGWYCAYLVDLYLQVPPDYFDAETGYKELPKAFTSKFTRDYRRHVSFSVSPDSASSGKQSRGKKKDQAKTDDKNKPKEAYFWYLQPLTLQSDKEIPEKKDDESDTDDE